MAEREITLTTIYEILKDHTARFNRMDQRFDNMDRRFDDVDKRFDDVDKRFSDADKRFDDVDKRFGDADKRVDSLKSHLDRIESVQNTLVLRVISIEAIVNEHSAILRPMRVRLDALHGLVEELERRTGRIEQEYVMITEALRRLETRFDKIEAERIKERISALEARVQALETTQA